MNHVKSALCRTAIVFKSPFFLEYEATVLYSLDLHQDLSGLRGHFSENVEEAHYTLHIEYEYILQIKVNTSRGIIISIH